MTKKTRGYTVKYKLYGKINFEKKFETAKEAKGFFFGYVVKTPNVTGELIWNQAKILLDKTPPTWYCKT